jgi:hypothetical protein
MVVVLGALLFVPAGTLAWVDVWAYLAIFVVIGGAITAMLLRDDPDLLAERMRPPIQRKQCRDDKTVLLDAQRFEWSRVPVAFPVWAGCSCSGTSR